MQEDQYKKERRHAEESDERSLTQAPENASPTEVKGNDDRVSQLQTWLALRTAREQRRYLESHCNLLDIQSESVLSDLLTQAVEGSEQMQRMRDALVLLQNARTRGVTTQAIREAYVDFYDGFALDVPFWLEEVESRLKSLHRKKQPYYTAEARCTLLQDALQRTQDNQSLSPEIIATLRGELAQALWQYPSNRDQALETALCLCEECLPIYTLARHPHQYAKIQRTLGVVWMERIAGERRENLERAISCYQEALHVWTLESSSYDFALTQNNLGIAYRQRVAEKRRENLELAIICNQKALRVYTLETFPFEYARSQNNLGLVYLERIAGERRENLERAITCFQEALNVHTLQDFPYDYAMAKNNLGLVYSEGIAGERRENLERAITCFQEALHVWTLESSPYDFALTQNNLGLVYWERIAGEHRENLERAITCFQEALLVRNREKSPYRYAQTQSNLSKAYLHRVMGKRQENLEHAILCCQEALVIYTLETYPFEYAEVQNNLGVIFLNRITGKRLENLKSTVICCQEALRVYTLDAFPYGYAFAQFGLGSAYKQRALEEENWEDLRQAIVYFRETLHVYTLESFPRDFRAVQLNIAEVEARCGNWKTAHNAYQEALNAQDALIVLGTGIPGRDAVLIEGGDATVRDGYVLIRLSRLAEAAIAIEHGRARGLAEALTLDAADPTLITDEKRRTRYATAREALITAQAGLHTPFPQDLDDDARRRLDLERTAAYRQVKAAYDGLVAEIRTAQDPADFLNAPLDADTILRAAMRVRSGHALVYLAATPWGGVAIAVLSAPPDGSSSDRFAVLDLPDLTEAFVKGLIEMRLDDGSERTIGGFALAQIGEGFEQLKKQWNGETFQAKAKALHAACDKRHQQSTLDSAAQETLKVCRKLALRAKQPLASLNNADLGELGNTFDHLFLQRELARCLEQLSTIIMHPLVVWLCEQGATSLTLIPCGHLATFPLATVLLPNGRSVSETLPTSIAPSVRSLLYKGDTRDTHAGVYALGDPQQNLPWSEAEALTLAALARRFELSTEAHTKHQATRERLLSALGSRWIVDASCHGTFDQQDFLRSALRLAQGGRITMSEMISHQADLRGLRLLLLSACQTALFDLQGARDEVHSLAAAMLQAGAQAVLAAQWMVDDKATYLLMVRFAQEWFPHMEQEPPAAALARAQVWLRNVTNADLAIWHSTMPTPAGMKPLMETTLKRRQAGKTTSRKPATRWEQIPVRGRSPRYLEEDARLAVRIEAEESDPTVRPYADPYFWAGFQVIGW